MKAVRNIDGFYYFWGIYGRRWGDSENYRFILTDILTAHVPCVWKRAKKIGSTTQSQDYQKTSLLNKKQSSKTKQKQENDQNRNLSYEVCFSSLSWKSLVETYKKEENSQSKQDKPRTILLHLVGKVLMSRNILNTGCYEPY